ncbi:ribosomal-protein-alanine N-acetyltransferase [Sphingorhabdus lutea]|uniref:Ribosomal-protein-alanine N-acetyltransferase n=1 Tax=Sphingorhabdus lutea TaxID=1913578 RepID=A0A1L3JD38_9SPHN|nr:ribosomal protein S18-alanine N-acetyltransferase [Sphingorhabdus lutea]APG63046.1 ribosomal-protein-alanine N-acetyltransferase [Sphingorhabdus lutea]
MMQRSNNEIIDANIDDIHDIMHIMNSAFDPQFGEAWTFSQCMSMMAMPRNMMMISYQQGQAAAFAILRVIMDEAELMMLGVHRDFQRKSLGSQLMQAIEDRLNNQNISTIFVEVRENNPALIFYENHGFSEFGRRKNYYKGIMGKQFDAITMAKSLFY